VSDDRARTRRPQEPSIGRWGSQLQTLVALSDRVVILKAGFLANASFGCRVTTIRYRDMTGIEVATGMSSAVLQVTSPSYSAVKADYWA
jgi:hypothetical protein